MFFVHLLHKRTERWGNVEQAEKDEDWPPGIQKHREKRGTDRCLNKPVRFGNQWLSQIRDGRLLKPYFLMYAVLGLDFVTIKLCMLWGFECTCSRVKTSKIDRDLAESVQQQAHYPLPVSSTSFIHIILKFKSPTNMNTRFMTSNMILYTLQLIENGSNIVNVSAQSEISRNTISCNSNAADTM
jgi:hypothetical protein